jgi:hypothetical protein
MNIFKTFESFLNEARTLVDAPTDKIYNKFKVWVADNEDEVLDRISKNASLLKSTGNVFQGLEGVWYKWAYKNEPKHKNISQTGKFGRALAFMLKNDDIIFDKSQNSLKLK